MTEFVVALSEASTKLSLCDSPGKWTLALRSRSAFRACYLSAALLDSFTSCGFTRRSARIIFTMVADFEIRHLFISAGHNYFGRHEKPPGDHAIIEVERIQCVTAKGIAGDRFFGFKKPIQRANHLL